MRDKRRVLTVASTFLLAAATGHVMQNGTNFTGRISSMGASAVPVEITTVAASATDLPMLPGLPAARPTRLGDGKALGIRVAALDQGHVLPTPTEDRAFDAFGLACTDKISATPEPGALIRVEIDASCRPNEAAVLRHAGLGVSMVTSPEGKAVLVVPALKAQAEIAVEFNDGTSLAAKTIVPDLAGLNRVVLQWQDTAALSLHALTTAGRIGGDGHISAEKPGEASTKGDFLTRIGDSAAPVPMLAEVYTYPADGKDRRVVIQAEVTNWNCGQVADGVTTMLRAGEAGAVHTDVTFAMPTCDATGDFVQMMPDLGPMVIASR